jgi:hypothetical protein
MHWVYHKKLIHNSPRNNVPQSDLVTKTIENESFKFIYPFTLKAACMCVNNILISALINTYYIVL